MESVVGRRKRQFVRQRPSSRLTILKAAPILVAGALLLVLCSAASQAVPARDRAAVPSMPPGDQLYVSNYENVLGTSLQLKIVASSEARSKQAEADALAEIDREAAIL